MTFQKALSPAPENSGDMDSAVGKPAPKASETVGGGGKRAATVAKRLTQAQIDALAYPSGYHDPNTIKALRRKGLWERGLLTAFGVEVRAIALDPTP